MKTIPNLVWSVLTKGLGNAYRELLPEASRDSVDWIRRQGVPMEGTRVLEAGCGFGSTAALLQEGGADVIAIDIELERVRHARRDGLQAALSDATALQFMDNAFDVILSVNVLEHLAEPRRFVAEAFRCLRAGGYLYLTWTNWYSPIGGHDFSPFHYLGPRLGYRVARRLRPDHRFDHAPFETMWPIHIGPTLAMLRDAGFELRAITPRHYPGLSFICRIPGLREVLTLNCQVLLLKPQADL